MSLIRPLDLTASRPQRTNNDPQAGCCEAIIAIFLPPLAVLLRRGCSGSFLLNILLTILGWLPGVIHAWIVILAEPSKRHRSSHSNNYHSSSYAGRHHHSHHHHHGGSSHGSGHGHHHHHHQGHTGRHHARPPRRSYDRGAPMMGYRDGYAAPPPRPVSGYGPPPPEMGYIPPPGRSRY